MTHYLRSGLPILGIAVLTLLLVVIPSHSEEITPRQKEIADLEKQIADLTRKLEELKKSPEPKATPPGAIPDDWVKALTWRSIGPATMGGRITAISVFEADPCVYWVATASGGLLKTTNNGVTFKHQFDHESTVSIGDVCVAPSDKNIVWVGTGENNPRNSVSFGDGVYKSTDGGDTWKNMGLKRTFQIGRIVVHPKNPDIVYVGALGRLYGPNEERGLFKTTDGGKTWDKVLFIDDKTGVIDVVIHPTEPDTLFVASWQRMRDGFDSHRGEPALEDGYDAYDPVKKWGPGGAIYKTTDGGKSFKKLTKGLPTCELGRIGLDIYRKNPNTLFAAIDCARIGMGEQIDVGIEGENVEGGFRINLVKPDWPAARGGLKPGDVVQKMNDKEVKNYEEFIDAVRNGKVGDKVPLRVLRDKDTRDVEVVLQNRPEKTFGVPFLGVRNEDISEGVKLVEVVSEGPAEKAGLKSNDLIVGIDKMEAKSMRRVLDVVNAKKPGDKVVLQILRGKEMKEIDLILGEREGSKPGTRPYSFFYGGQQANKQQLQGPNGHEFGGVYKSIDGGENWTRINSLNPRPMYFSQVRVDPSDEKFVYLCGIRLYRSSDGGKTFKPDGAKNVHDDQHALWIDPRDGRHAIVGTDGGFYASYDRMDNWDHLSHLALGQFYHVAVDNRNPYRVYGGLQDNGTWGGPSRTLSGIGPINEDWSMVNWGDGFVCRVDAGDPDIVYGESQDGNMVRINLRTGKSSRIFPLPQKGHKYRFNWNTPFILSQHNAKIFYAGGNYVFRSVKQGEDLRVISPEIARTGRGTASALAESPLNPDVLYAGTDDGNLWVTRDGGKNWTNVADKIGTPGPRWVASIEASRFAEGRAYITLDGHRSDDDAPHVYMTEDFGASWKSLRGNLPTGSTRVLREDLFKEDVLYLGTEFSVFASVNRGGVWTKINNNLPTVAIHELAQHPTTGEIVAATHGRSLWILDISALRQINAEVLKNKTYLFEPQPTTRMHREPSKGAQFFFGARKFVGENPPHGVQLYYSLGAKAEKVSLKVVDYSGKPIADLKVSRDPGLHRSVWELPYADQKSPASGVYRAVLTVDGKEFNKPVRIEVSSASSSVLIAPDE